MYLFQLSVKFLRCINAVLSTPYVCYIALGLNIIPAAISDLAISEFGHIQEWSAGYISTCSKLKKWLSFVLEVGLLSSLLSSIISPILFYFILFWLPTETTDGQTTGYAQQS